MLFRSSKGGNYLLNVGPDADGAIPQPSQDVLRKVGAWLKVNGEAIYGAGRTPFGQEFGGTVEEKNEYGKMSKVSALRDWRCTTKPGRLYIHLFKWPGEKFEMSGLTGIVSRAYLLADRRPLQFAQAGERLSVSLPEDPPDALATVLCLELPE